MQVINVAQAPTINSGTIIRGITLPCIRKKYGSFE